MNSINKLSEMHDMKEVYTKDKLDEALLEKKRVIIIKDSKLGEGTTFWIRVGNCFDAMTLAAACGSAICSAICSADVHHDVIHKYAKPLAVCSLVGLIGNQLTWSRSPLMRYKIEQGPSICDIIKGDYSPPSTILVRDDAPDHSVMKIMVCVTAAAVAFWNDVKSFDYKEAMEKFKTIQEEKLNFTE